MAPEYILLLQHGVGNHRTPIHSSATATLQEMLGVQYYPNPPNTLYYEVLNMTIQEYESKQYVRVSYVDSCLKEQGPFDLFVLKTSTVGDIVQELMAQQVKPEENGSGQLRVYEVTNFRIYRVCDKSDLLQNISLHSVLYVEEVPSEELKFEQGDQLVQVCHYNREVLRGHGIPTQFLLKAASIF